MALAHHINKAHSERDALPLRSPEVVMDIARLGSLHPTRMSFMRALVRKMMREKWQVNAHRVALDEQGLGTIIYRAEANGRVYSLVLFSHFLADEDRNDRVIAQRWDTTMTLCRGEVSEADLKRMQANVPKQEAGRATTQQIVLSRGNRSSRNFAYVVNRLAAGKQPEMTVLARVGYLYRTTAVYGSGKFGMADWETVRDTCPEFSSPFSAEMFACLLLRDFSVRQAEHLAKLKSPQTAVTMQAEIQRFLGIGNSTGLGMAPYLIRHPQLISRWVLAREQAIAAVTYLGACERGSVQRLDALLDQVLSHLDETTVPDAIQTDRNQTLKSELRRIRESLPQRLNERAIGNWQWLTELAAQTMSLETQEMLNSLLMELEHELIDEQFIYAAERENISLDSSMRLDQLKLLLEQHYAWALKIDFSDQQQYHFFWYVSEEKQEPRLGQRCSEPGVEKEQPLIIAKRIHDLYNALEAEQNLQQSVAMWLLKNSAWSGTISRAQTMASEVYGEIRGNLAAEDLRPLDLLRCKLSFFGVSKFDPKSRLWVRNTMFQGAPTLADINANAKFNCFKDNWCFPVALQA